MIGTDALRRHVADAGLRVLNGTDLASRAEVVVVGGTEDLVYDDLRDAALAVRRGADFLATAPRPHLPAAGRPLARHRRDPGRGRDGERAQAAQIVGKPEPQLSSRRSTGSAGARTLVVGDRLDTDLAAAAAAGLDAALVLTGGTERQALNGFEPRARRGGDTLADLILGNDPD